MSYTPDDQLLEKPLENAAEALAELRAPLFQRIKNPQDWSATHLMELGELIKEVTDLEVKLRRLRGIVR